MNSDIYEGHTHLALTNPFWKRSCSATPRSLEIAIAERPLTPHPLTNFLQTQVTEVVFRELPILGCIEPIPVDYPEKFRFILIINITILHLLRWALL